jgi:hypothetical protein
MLTSSVKSGNAKHMAFRKSYLAQIGPPAGRFVNKMDEVCADWKPAQTSSILFYERRRR